MVSQIDQLRKRFNEMTTAEKNSFINSLMQKLQSRKNKEYIKFLNECVNIYNKEVQSGSKATTANNAMSSGNIPMETISKSKKSPLLGALIAMLVVLVVAMGGLFAFAIPFIMDFQKMPSDSSFADNTSNSSSSSDVSSDGISGGDGFSSSSGIYLFNDTVTFYMDMGHWLVPTAYINSNNSVYIITRSGSNRIMDNVRSVHMSGGQYDRTFFVITKNNDLYAWGNNRQGQIGDDSGLNKTEPVFIMGNVAAVATTDSEVRAFSTDGTCWRWGGGVFAPVEEGIIHDIIDYIENQTVMRLNPIVMSNGNMEVHTMIGLKNEIVNALGGQDNIVSSRGVGGRPDFMGITVHPRYYALTRDGVLWGWGKNDGQLGDGTRATRNMPVQIAENVKRITPTHFVTNNNDWYFYSTTSEYGGRYGIELYRPLIAFHNVAYVNNITKDYGVPGVTRGMSSGPTSNYGSYFTPEGQLVRISRGSPNFMSAGHDLTVEVILDDVMLPSMVRIS
jgi:hypothetical protein